MSKQTVGFEKGVGMVIRIPLDEIMDVDVTGSGSESSPWFVCVWTSSGHHTFGFKTKRCAEASRRSLLQEKKRLEAAR